MKMAGDEDYPQNANKCFKKSNNKWQTPYPDEIQYLDSYSPGMDLDPLATSSDFSYNLDLHSILDDHKYPRLQVDRPLNI